MAKRSRPDESTNDNLPIHFNAYAPPFTFGFASGVDTETCVVDETRAIAAAATRPAATTGVVVHDYIDPASGASFLRSDTVAINWGASNNYRLCVERLSVPAGRAVVGHVPPSVVRLCSTDRFIVGTMQSPTIIHHDAVWMPASSVGAIHPISSPLLLEPGLAAFAWPLTPAAFKSEIWARSRLFVVHSSGARLSELSGLFHGFDVRRMIRDASKLVVWMRGTEGERRMHFLDASPEVAAAAYDAGHSIYFNPPLDVQQRLVSALADDLNIGVRGRKWAPPPPPEAGDVEVFAVRGRHLTPWHYDAQANFTVQVKGTKIWSICLPRKSEGSAENCFASIRKDDESTVISLADSDVREPYSNLHPSSSNEDALLVDAALHAMCATTNDASISRPEVVRIAMRPGSVLYLPSGTWHQVEADDDDGSLSINISLSGSSGRWADILLKRLAPAMWGDPALRRRLGGPPAHCSSMDGVPMQSEVRSACATAIQRLTAIVSALTPEDIIPDALLEEEEDGDDSSEHVHLGSYYNDRVGDNAMPSYTIDDGVEGDDTSVNLSILDRPAVRGSLVSLFAWPPHVNGAPRAHYFALSGFGGIDGVGRPDMRVRLVVCGTRLVSAVSRLATLLPGSERVTLRSLMGVGADEGSAITKRYERACAQVSFLLHKVGYIKFP